MNTDKIRKVDDLIIVGGGTSAWLTAAMLSNNLPHLNVTIVDKEVGTPVGVGEGTLLSFEKVMDRCGFHVNDWFPAIDATMKAGILFPGWGKNQSDVWHPFFFPQMPALKTSQYNVWSKNQDFNFQTHGLSFYDISINKDMVDYEALNSYAYHIDAGKLVTFIQKELEQRPRVQLIKSDVVEIFRDDQTHNITSLKLKNGQEITADLYVDCTGFKQLLAYQPDRVTCEGRLFCDTAIAAHVPYEDIDKELHPYVISEQVDHGWVWNIPVQTRIGSGLVFSRSKTDIEEAKDYFVNYWNNRISKDKLKVIDWTPYYNKNAWHENVVAIGLSAGFIEPLESTGIALIIVGAEQLTFALEGRYYNQSNINYFNMLIENYFEDCIDFVSMHYALPEKDTPFWNWVKETWVKSDKQKWFEEEILKTDRPLPISNTGYVFCGNNWICWLVQMGYPINEAYDGLNKSQARQQCELWHNIEMSRSSHSAPHSKYIEFLKSKLHDKI